MEVMAMLFSILLMLYSSSRHLVTGQISRGLPCDQNALGMEDAWIQDADITASSLLNVHHDPGKARLHGNSAWMPLGSDTSPVLQIYLQGETNISAIAIQGHPMRDYWVTNYSLAFSLDGQTWKNVSEVFTGNLNNWGTSKTVLREPKAASFLRIQPLQWHESVSIRTEIYGCTKNFPKCGIHSRRNQHSRQKRVIGGKPAQPNSWPWQVEILNATSMQHWCGGSLIHPEYIITAGHCVEKQLSPVNTQIRLGEHNNKATEGYEEIFEAEESHLHPGYIRGTKASPGDYDIGIIRLNKPAMLYDRVGTVCLPDETSTYTPGDECFVTGWGKQKEGSSIFADVLNELKVPLVSLETCNKNESYKGVVNEHFMCAGYPAGGKDACYGDSGGPLVCRDEAGRWVLTGSVSWGEGCAKPDKYGVYVDIQRLLPFIESTIYGYPACGIRFLSAQHSRQKRVVGGKEARPNSWPWQVELLVNGTQHYCGGSLIGPSWVVTSGHCFWMHKNPDAWEVRVGEHDKTKYEGYEEHIGIEEIHVHPGFVLGSFDYTGDYDIALLKLKRPAVFHRRVHSICLPTEQTSKPEIGKTCFVSGWGKHSENSSEYSKVLMEVEVPLVSREVCNSNTSYNGGINRRYFCAGYPRGGIDSCYGDSGGPMVCANEENVFTLMGIVSWGQGCARPQKYGVYLDVQLMMPFIQSTMNGHPNCGVRYLPSQSARVVGGSEARPNSWPWQVDLLVNGTQHYCGGSLIGPSWVVTSAHCFWMYKDPEVWEVRVGEHNETKYEGFEETIMAGKIFIHPKFVLGTENATGDFDIALVKLSRPAVFHDRVHSVCLPDEHGNLTAGQQCHVTGWGATNESGSYSKVLKEAAVNLVSSHVCNVSYDGIINERYFCAGVPSGGIDACYGDSGGPLVCQEGDGHFFLAGIVSWGIGCARPGKPGVYLDVRQMLSFINSTIEAAV